MTAQTAHTTRGASWWATAPGPTPPSSHRAVSTPPACRAPRRVLPTTRRSFPSSRSTPPSTRPPTSATPNAGRRARRPASSSTSRPSPCSRGTARRPNGSRPSSRRVLPADVAGKRNVYLRDLGAQAEELLYETHRRALAPLHAAGKLGAVLLQFPPWFRAGHEGREHIRRAVRELAPYRVAVEFRGGGWLADDAAAARTLSFLESAGASYVSVDEPQGFPNSTPPLSAATSDLAVVRFHGRNRDTWQVRGRAASDRFNYLYEAVARRVGAPDPRPRRAGTQRPRPLQQQLPRLRRAQRPPDDGYCWPRPA